MGPVIHETTAFSWSSWLAFSLLRDFLNPASTCLVPEERLMCDDVRDNGPLPQELAVEMIPVIRRIAYRLAKRLPSHVCIDDLISAGVVGLITAYRRFDPARGDDFRSYAELRIRGAMIDELRASDPLSRDLRAHANRTLAARLLGVSRRTLYNKLQEHGLS